MLQPSRWPSTRAGKNSTARKNANTASNAMPSSRNGSEISQTIGQSTSASNAIGQHSTNNSNQPTSARKEPMAPPDRPQCGQRNAARAARQRLPQRGAEAFLSTLEFVYE